MRGKNLTYYGQVATIIGTGGFSTVYSTNKGYAIKKLKINSVQIYLREVASLSNLNHPNIIRLLDVFIDDATRLVFEKMDYNLQVYLSREKPCLATIKSLSYQLLRGINICHENRILHRDIKSINIGISQNILKLLDFGSSLILSDDDYKSPAPMTCPVTTLWYRAPELLLGSTKYSFATDMWAVGCVISEIFNGCPLVVSDCEIGLLFEIFKLFGTPTRLFESLPLWQDVFPKFKPTFDNLLFHDILQLDPAKRLSAREIMNLEFFNDVGNLIETTMPEVINYPCQKRKQIDMTLVKRVAKELALSVKTVDLAQKILEIHFSSREPLEITKRAVLSLANEYCEMKPLDEGMFIRDSDISSTEIQGFKRLILEKLQYNVYPI